MITITLNAVLHWVQCMTVSVSVDGLISLLQPTFFDHQSDDNITIRECSSATCFIVQNMMWTHWEAGRYDGMKTKTSNKNLGPSFGVVTQPYHPFKTAHQVTDFHCRTNARNSIRSLSNFGSCVLSLGTIIFTPIRDRYHLLFAVPMTYWQLISLKLNIRCLSLIRRPDRVEGLEKGNAVHRSFSVVKR